MQYPITLVGQATQGDSVYMKLRTIELPNKKGMFAFPIKVYRNRKRGHNKPYAPDICVDTKQSTESLQNFISSKL